MNSFIIAALLMCRTGDPVIAERIAAEAIKQDTNVVVAMTVGIMESGLQGPNNPMGINGCLARAKAKHHRTTGDCIRIGVTSIHNRLWDAKVTLPTATAIRKCGGTGNSTMCRALAVYNGQKGNAKYAYAKRAMGIIRRIYQLVGAEVPTT